jgi:DAD family
MEPLNKYKNNLKNKKKFIDVFFYLYIIGHSNFIQFHYRLIVHQRPSNFHIIYNGFKLTVFDELSNDNEMT